MRPAARSLAHRKAPAGRRQVADARCIPAAFNEPAQHRPHLSGQQERLQPQARALERVEGSRGRSCRRLQGSNRCALCV